MNIKQLQRVNTHCVLVESLIFKLEELRNLNESLFYSVCRQQLLDVANRQNKEIRKITDGVLNSLNKNKNDISHFCGVIEHQDKNFSKRMLIKD